MMIARFYCLFSRDWSVWQLVSRSGHIVYESTEEDDVRAMARLLASDDGAASSRGRPLAGRCALVG